MQQKEFHYAISDMNLNIEATSVIPRDYGCTFPEQLCSIVRIILEQNKYVRAISVSAPGAISMQKTIVLVPT